MFVVNCTITWRQPSLSRGFINILGNLGKTHRQTDKQTDNGVCRVASTTNNQRG